MADLTCPLCHEDFDLVSRTPRFMTNCGHTFCANCCERLLVGAKDGFVECPEDNILTVLSNPEQGIINFPPNLAFNKILSARRSRPVVVEGREAPRPSDFSGLHVCPEHQKMADLFCLTDRKVICVDCGLFGDHRNHNFKRFDLFKNETKKKLEQFKVDRESYNILGQFANYERKLSESRVRIALKQERSIKSIERSFETIISKLKNKEHNLKEVLNHRFQKFEQVMTVLTNVILKIREKDGALTNLLTKLNNQISNKYVDFTYIFDNVWGKEDLNGLLKEIIDEFSGFDDKMNKFVDVELDKINNGLNFEGVLSWIDSSITADSLFVQPTEDKKDASFSRSKLKEVPINVRQSSNGEYDSSDVKRDLLRVEVKSGAVMRNSHAGSRNNERFDDFELSRDEGRSSAYGSRKGFPLEPKRKSMIENLEESILDSNDLDNSIVDNFQIDDSFDKVKSSVVRKPTNAVRPLLKTLAKDEPMSPSIHVPPSRSFTSHYGSATPQYNSSIVKKDKGIDKSVREVKAIKYETERAKQVSSSRAMTPKQSVKPTSKSPARRPDTKTIVSSSQTTIAKTFDSEELNYSNKDLDDNKLYMLFFEFMKNKKAKVLNLDNNKISEIGFGLMISKLSTHPSLEKISMSNNYANESILDKIIESAKKLKHIRHFVFKNNKYFRKKADIKKGVAALEKLNIKVEV